jgi:hypothetical protein
MREAEFTAIYEELTPKQRKVLQGFLAGATDEAIAVSLYVEASTIRRHLANICKEFGFSNTEGEHYSYREELVDLFAQHRPDLVHPQFTGKHLSDLEFPGSPLAVDSPLYVMRSPIEDRCFKEITKPVALIRICAPVAWEKLHCFSGSWLKQK